MPALRGSFGLVGVLLALNACSSGGGQSGQPDSVDASSDLDDRTSRLAFLTMRSDGSACYDECWREFTVRARGTLELEDRDGKVLFEISEAAFGLIQDLTRRTEFLKEVERSRSEAACGGFDIHVSMRYQMVGEPPQVVPSLNSCAIEEGNVLADIYSNIRALTEDHLVCPPWEEPEQFELATDPLPDRPLCWFCYGRCVGNSLE